MKIILCISVCGGCTVLGLLKSLDLWNRLQTLRDIREFLIWIQNRIWFEQTELHMIFSEGSAHGPKRLRSGCQCISDQWNDPKWNDFSELWNKTWENAFSMNVQKEEKELWNRLGRHLGRGSQEQQVQIIKQSLQELDRLESDLYTEYKLRGKMYCSVGACIGLFISILLI